MQLQSAQRAERRRRLQRLVLQSAAAAGNESASGLKKKKKKTTTTFDCWFGEMSQSLKLHVNDQRQEAAFISVKHL